MTSSGKVFCWLQPRGHPVWRAWVSTVRLAWRNLWRRPQRTLLLTGVVAYATAATIVYWSCVDGYVESVLAAHARYLAAPVRVTTAAWFRDPDPSHALKDLSFVPSLREHGLVKAAAPRLELPVRIRSAYASEGQLARGVDPYAEQSLSRLAGKLAEGQWLSEPGQVLLGHRLAKRLDVTLHERIILEAASLVQGKARALRVVGLIDTGITLLDQNAVLIHLSDARALAELTSATSVDLTVVRGQEAKAIAAITPLLPDNVAAYSVWDMVGPIKTDLMGAKLSAIPVGVLLSIFAVITVVSTIFVSVVERKREFAVMKALGCPPQHLATLVVAESLLVSFIGWLIGLLLGYGLAWILATHNILGHFFAVSGRVWPSSGIAEELYAAVHPIYSVYALGTTALVALFCTLVPANYVRTLETATAMRTS